MKRYPATILFLIFILSTLYAQQTPAPNQNGSILIMGATAHLGTGRAIESSVIALDEGKIVMVADMSTIRIDRSAYDRVIDATGKHVYPGFIATNTQIGLREVDAVRSTRDDSEVGGLNPNVRAIIAYNTDSDVTPTIRSNGVLLAEIVPRGGRISGCASIVELDGWNWEDAAYKMDHAIHVNWPSLYRWDWSSGTPIRKVNDKYRDQLTELKNYFHEARAYASSQAQEKNLRFEAMRKLFTKEVKLFIHTNEAKSILEVIDFKNDLDLDVALVGAREAWLVADQIKDSGIPVVLSNLHRTPSREDEDIDKPYRIATILHNKGVDFCLSMGGAWQQRNLAFQAGQAVAYGLPYEEAIKALTAGPANILGIGQNVGSLEKGKDATLIISTGDVLDMRTSVIEKAFIRGKEIDLGNKQEELYKKFQDKYAN